MPEEGTTEEGTTEEGLDTGATEEGTEETKTFTIDQWRESIPEDLASEASLADIKDVEGLVKGYVSAQKSFGKDKTYLPREDWTSDDWNNFYKASGRPDTDVDYKLNNPENAPEDWPSNIDYENDFRKEVHDIGLSKRQGRKVWDFLQKQALNSYTGQSENNSTRLEEGHDAIKKEYGAKYDEVSKKSNNMIMKLDKDGSIRKWLQDSGASQEPMLHKLVMKLAESLGEDTITDSKPGGAVKLTPKEAMSKISKMEEDSYKVGDSHPLNDNFHPDHEKVKAERLKLYEYAYPEGT
ncbi:MAG: hypothetical protein ACTSX1_02195 [Candidatus Heimdallarchaeaceae archaeon]